MSAGRTYWLALDARWLAREGVVEAREEAGADAVVVLLALMGQAKLENDGGRVRTGYRALAREAFLAGPDEARAIVTVCHASSLLDDFKEDEDGRRFSCRLSGWSADQEKGRAADRKSASRGKNNGHVEPSPDDESRPVTGSHGPVVEERTGENRREALSLPQPHVVGQPSEEALVEGESVDLTSRPEAERVACPSCGTPPGAKCIRVNGEPRDSSHAERHAVAIAGGAKILKHEERKGRPRRDRSGSRSNGTSPRQLGQSPRQRAAAASSMAGWDAWAAEHMPDVTPTAVIQAAFAIAAAQNADAVTVETVTARLRATHPYVLEEAA